MKNLFAVSCTMSVLLAVLVMSSGCSFKSSKKVPSPDTSSSKSSAPSSQAPSSEVPGSSVPDPSTPDGAAEILLEQVTDLDGEKIKELASQYFTMEQIPDACYSVLLPISQRVTYEIKSCKINGDKAKVDVSVTSVDAKKALNSAMPGAVAHLAALQISGKDISDPVKILSEYAAKNIEWDKLPTIETDSALYMAKAADGEWKVDASNPDNIGFADAISGGAVTLAQDLEAFAERFR